MGAATMLAAALALLSPAPAAAQRASPPAAPAGATPEPPPKFLCELRSSNWNRRTRGIFVTGDGGVHSFERRQGAPALPSDGFTDADLEQRYAQRRERIGTADEATVRTAALLIRSARAGPYSKRVQTAYDAGAESADCFDYDAVTGRYRLVTLRLRGDVSEENLAPAARRLVRWLDRLAELAAPDRPR